MLENEMRDEMVRLLRYANRQKVGAALGVSRASVSDWATGRHVTPGRLAQVRALFDAPDTTKPPPTWAAVMHEELLAAIREAGWTPQERAAVRAIDATARPTPEADADPPETGLPAPAHRQRHTPQPDQ